MAVMKSKTKGKKWLLFLVVVFFIVGLGLAGACWAWENNYRDKIYPGVKVGDVDLGGKTKVEAKKTLEKKITELNREGIQFRYRENSTKITPTISSFSGGLAYNIMTFNLNQTVNRAYSFGRKENFWKSGLKKVQAWRSSHSIPLEFNIKKKEIEKILKKNFKEQEVEPKPATLEVTEKNNKGPDLQIKESNSGEVIDYSQGISDMKNQLRALDLSPIELSSKKIYPDIHKKDCQDLKPRAQNLLERAPLNLLTPIEGKDNASKEWTINKTQLANWLQIKKATSGKVKLGLDQEKIIKFLKETIAPEVDQEPEKARFEMKNDRVVKFKASQDGIKLDRKESARKIEKEFLKNNTSEIKLSTEKVESEITAQKANDLGVEKIIGTGHSNFAGSPPNRVHNIQVGAESLKGILIKPGEEFSLVEALGEISKEKGYKPELVIKGNETVPEYGGGLCQIATTIFRAALRSGLEITARTSHSYQVSYYKPTGMDATVYIPRPDLKFKNDTGSHILIQYRIEGSDLYFDFWGTDDGREVEITEPTVYNIKNPGPTKIIKTDELEPGKRKCTESAHKGADAYFDYKVTYPDEEAKERRFHSHYVPWREVCLVGEEKEPDNKKEGATGTSTPSSSTNEDE